MALFWDGMPCGLCHEPMLESQQRFGTWGVWLPDSDRLAKYCDAVFHWECYASWPSRPRFARSYFDFWIADEEKSPHWWRSYQDSDVFVTVNPEIGNIWAHLSETGSRQSVSLATWEQWLRELGCSQHPVEEAARHHAKATLQRVRPTSQSLLDAIDQNSKLELFQQIAIAEQQRAESDRQRQLKVDEHNALCEQVLPVIRKSKNRCPSCRDKTGEFRLSTLRGRESLIICRTCGHVVDPQIFATSIPRSNLIH